MCDLSTGKVFIIRILILVLGAWIFIGSWTGASNRPFSDRVFEEGKQVFYHYLKLGRSFSRNLDGETLEILSQGEKKLSGLFEILMNSYYWLEDWENLDSHEFRSHFRAVSGRMAVEFLQSLSIPPYRNASSLEVILKSAGYYSLQSSPQTRRFFRPMTRFVREQWAFKALGVQRTHSITDGKGVRVAIIDTGIDRSVKEFRSQIHSYRNFLSRSQRPWEKGQFPYDWRGHGTSVASVIHQVAPKAELIIIKHYEEDSMKDFPSSRWTSYRLAGAIRWAVTEGADVINISSAVSSDMRAIREAVRYCWENNVIVVSSAGNVVREEIRRIPFYPAAYPWTIAVGGVEKMGDDFRIWPYSSWGEYIDVVAPASRLLVEVPLYRGQRLTSMQAYGNSLAAGFVSGTIALMISVMDKHSRELLGREAGDLCETVREILHQTASNERLGFFTPNPVSGHGLLEIGKAVNSARRHRRKEGRSISFKGTYALPPRTQYLRIFPSLR